MLLWQWGPVETLPPPISGDRGRGWVLWPAQATGGLLSNWKVHFSPVPAGALSGSQNP